MPEKREAKKRCLKRLQLRFGTEGPTRLGFTEDISKDGLFIKTANFLLPKTNIKVEISIPGKDPILLEGVVVWAKKVHPGLIAYVKKSGMGVKITRFISGEEIYKDLC